MEVYAKKIEDCRHPQLPWEVQVLKSGTVCFGLNAAENRSLSGASHDLLRNDDCWRRKVPDPQKRNRLQ